MSIGEDGDFRTTGFKQVMRFPGQGTRGGTGSPFLPQITPPAGSSSSISPVPPLTLPVLGNGTFSFPAGLLGVPGTQMPTLNPFVPQTGDTTAGTITVIDSVASPGAATYTGIDTLNLMGNVTLAAGTTANIVDITVGSGGGGGTTLKYGKITSSSRPSATIGKWDYTVSLAPGLTTSVTAYNLLEKENTSTVAYGYTVTGGDRISGTSYYVRAVPNNTWVRMEQTSDVTGTSSYWFSAPNFIQGSC